MNTIIMITQYSETQRKGCYANINIKGKKYIKDYFSQSNVVICEVKPLIYRKSKPNSLSI